MRAAARFGLSAIGALLLGASGPGLALDPQRSLTQLHHKAWTIEDGAPPDVWALAQSSDGYLWLGTGAGLYRFDGVRFDKFQPVAGDRMPSANINALHASSNGDLWIGYNIGQISRLRRGRLTTFDLGFGGIPVFQIVEDRNAVLWAAVKGHRRGGLMRYAGKRWTRIGQDWGLPEGGVSSVLPARDGALWVASGDALRVLRPGARQFEKTRERASDRTRIIQAPDDRIWVSPGGNLPIHPVAERLQPRSSGRWPVGSLLLRREGSGEQILVDRDNVLWGTRKSGGIFRIGNVGDRRTGANFDHWTGEDFTLADGLSSDLANPLLEDREGNIWVGTNLGLDRFRHTNAVAAPGVPLTSRQGFQVTAGKDGAVYVATGDTLFRAYPERPAERIAAIANAPRSLYTDRSNRVWMGTDRGIAYLDGKELIPQTLPGAVPRGAVGWVEDSAGTLCASMLQGAILCRSGGRWTRARFQAAETKAAPVQLARDSKDRIWFNYEDHLVLLDGARRTVFSQRDGLSVGSIEIVVPSGEDVYVGGDFGVARFDGRRFQTLRSEKHPLLSRISGIVQSADGDLWLNGIAGVVRVAAGDLPSAFAHPDRPLRMTLFDLDDGLPGVAQQDSNAPTAIAASDGRLWFVTSHGVAWIDPRRLGRNPLPPPVSITQLVAGDKRFDFPRSIDLPAGTTSLQIDYAALSLSIPERVRFRYQLEGVDAGWIDPGTRRQAFYTGLGPGHYRFRVIAANNDGVWNRTGATLTFIIRPTFVQSIWFKLLAAGAVLTGAWLIYSLRMRQIAERNQRQLEERLRERERIARELHDTLLQGFQGLVYRFQSAMNLLPATHKAYRAMETALDLADDALAEGRDRVYNLRTAAPEDDVSQHLANVAARATPAFAGSFRVVVEGQPRTLHPVVCEEIQRIGEEAVSNALRHSHAANVDVNIVYHAREFVLQIVDNGVGIAPDVIAHGAGEHHFGLTGMRERAELIRGRFKLSSRPGGGTQVTLTVPASIAYAKAPTGKWRFFRFRRLDKE